MLDSLPYLKQIGVGPKRRPKTYFLGPDPPPPTGVDIVGCFTEFEESRQ